MFAGFWLSQPHARLVHFLFTHDTSALHFACGRTPFRDVADALFGAFLLTRVGATGEELVGCSTKLPVQPPTLLHGQAAKRCHLRSDPGKAVLAPKLC